MSDHPAHDTQPIAMLAILAVALVLLTPRPAAAAEGNGLIKWQSWTDDLFARAQREQRFVILDLEAVWCHWCHVMEETTYAEPKVADLINAKYIPVRVDQDANPDLAARYGDWGWPATIVFAPDGTEIVKRRGYIPPVFMISLLQAIIDDPSPGPSVLTELEVEPTTDGALSAKQHQQLQDDYWQVYDRENGGWGNVHKFIELYSLQYALAQAQKGSRVHELMARQTLNQALYLIDPAWGGIYQYSDQQDWRSPHYEKIMLTQSTAIRVYALAHQLYGENDSRYLDAAKAVAGYLRERMLGTNGAFYTSQDADLDRETTGKVFYNLGAEQRARFDKAPRIDTNQYTRENGWAITAMLALYDATGEAQLLDTARRAAAWIVANRTLGDGGYRHGETDRGGPFLTDNVAAAEAFTAMYASTGERVWLTRASAALTFVDSKLRSANGGFLSHPVPTNAVGVFAREVLSVEENVAMARAANQMHVYLGQQQFADMANHAMRYLTAPALLENRLFLHGVLLAAEEVGHEPIHITIVGAKSDPKAQALHKSARAYPGVFKRVDWWDRSEGPLPNPDIRYPQLERAAAFACTNSTCSLPVFDAAKVAPMVARLLNPAAVGVATR